MDNKKPHSSEIQAQNQSSLNFSQERIGLPKTTISNPSLNQLPSLNPPEDNISPSKTANLRQSQRQIIGEASSFNFPEKKDENPGMEATLINQETSQKRCKKMVIIIFLLILMTVTIKVSTLLLDKYFSQGFPTKGEPRLNLQMAEQIDVSKYNQADIIGQEIEKNETTKSEKDKKSSMIVSQGMNQVQNSKIDHRLEEIKLLKFQLHQLQYQTGSIEQQNQLLNLSQTRSGLKIQPSNSTYNKTVSQEFTNNQTLSGQNNDLIDKKQINKARQTQQTLTSGEKQNFTLRTSFRSMVSPTPKPGDDRYDYNSSADSLVENSALKKKYRDATWLSHQLQIRNDPAQHERAIRLLELTHNINFRGEFVMDHFNFYSSPQQKYETLKKLIDEDKAYFEKKYQISKYIHDQIRFCVYVPSHNNAHNRIYLRNLDSIFQQEYTNYHVVYVDDASTDGTADYVEKYMVENEIPPSMYTIVRNTKNMGNSHNIYVAGNNFCKPGEIMVLVDGDDMIIGRQVLSLLNAFYQKNKPAIVYTQFLFVRLDHIGNSTNREIDPKVLDEGIWRKKKDFVTWHLKSFHTDLFRMIKKEDMKFGPNEWIPHSSDVAYMTPMIEMAGKRLKFLPETMYEYRHDLSSNEQPQGFRYSNPKIFAKAPYKYVQNMQFVQNLITTHFDRLPDEEKIVMQQRQNVQNISVFYYDPDINESHGQISQKGVDKHQQIKVSSDSKLEILNQNTAKNQPKPQTINKPKENSKLLQKEGGKDAIVHRQIPPPNPVFDLYEFKQSSDELVENSSLKKFYNDSPWLENQEMYGVKAAQHERAIRLMEVTHNVNFRGQIVVENWKHYDSEIDKYQTLKRLLIEEKLYYESRYKISEYLKNQIRFCVVVVSYNNVGSRIYLRNLDSIFQQEYQNYHLVYINDASTDQTKAQVEKYMKTNEIPPNFYTLINNEKNMLSSHNIYMAAHEYCNLGEVMVLVDGDDALIGRQVFSLLNAYYQTQKPALVYTQLLFIYPDHIGNSRNQPINTTLLQQYGAWRKLYRFCTSHLKTFYVDLFRMIQKQDLQFGKDEWIPHSSDVAFMTPMLEMAGSRVKFLTEVTYEYRHDTNANQAVEGFRRVNPKIFAKKPYNLVRNLTFADNPKTTYYP